MVFDGFGRFWKVFDGNVWFYASFKRFLKLNVVFPYVLIGFPWKCLVLVRVWKVLNVKAHQSFQTYSFHYIKSMLWEAFRS